MNTVLAGLTQNCSVVYLDIVVTYLTIEQHITDPSTVLGCLVFGNCPHEKYVLSCVSSIDFMGSSSQILGWE